MTVLTSYLITALCLYIYVHIKKGDAVRTHWSYFFLFIGISTLLGGCSHAFFQEHSGITYFAIWIPGQIANISAIYFAQLATIETFHPGSAIGVRLKKLCRLELIGFSALLMIVQKFIIIVINTALGLIPIMVVYYIRGGKSGRLIATGILVSFLTAICFIGKFSLHRYFNYMDIAHVLMLISLWVMYKGINHVTEDQCATQSYLN